MPPTGQLLLSVLRDADMVGAVVMLAACSVTTSPAKGPSMDSYKARDHAKQLVTGLVDALRLGPLTETQNGGEPCRNDFGPVGSANFSVSFQGIITASSATDVRTVLGRISQYGNQHGLPFEPLATISPIQPPTEWEINAKETATNFSVVVTVVPGDNHIRIAANSACVEPVGTDIPGNEPLTWPPYTGPLS